MSNTTKVEVWPNGPYHLIYTAELVNTTEDDLYKFRCDMAARFITGYFKPVDMIETLLCRAADTWSLEDMCAVLAVRTRLKTLFDKQAEGNSID